MQDNGLRRPYEPLLLARPVGCMAHAAAAGTDGSGAQQKLPNLAIFAVPGQHSRKPHLGRLLAPHLPRSPSLLEVGLPKPRTTVNRRIPLGEGIAQHRRCCMVLRMCST